MATRQTSAGANPVSTLITRFETAITKVTADAERIKGNAKALALAETLLDTHPTLIDGKALDALRAKVSAESPNLDDMVTKATAYITLGSDAGVTAKLAERLTALVEQATALKGTKVRSARGDGSTMTDRNLPGRVSVVCDTCKATLTEGTRDWDSIRSKVLLGDKGHDTAKHGGTFKLQAKDARDAVKSVHKVGRTVSMGRYRFTYVD